MSDCFNRMPLNYKLTNLRPSPNSAVQKDCHLRGADSFSFCNRAIWLNFSMRQCVFIDFRFTQHTNTDADSYDRVYCLHAQDFLCYCRTVMPNRAILIRCFCRIHCADLLLSERIGNQFSFNRLDIDFSIKFSQITLSILIALCKFLLFQTLKLFNQIHLKLHQNSNAMSFCA